MAEQSSLKQPKAFYLIFFLELWERFGYYGMQGILALYFVDALGYTQADAFATFGAFTALVFGLVSIGGYIGDKVLGTRRTIILGAIVLAIGYFFLAFSNPTTVFFALGIVCVGNGLFKANPSSLLSKCYKKGDPRLHGAFTLYYMAINIGSFIALLISPALAAHYGWDTAFLVCGIGLVVAIFNFFFMYGTIRNIHIELEEKSFPMKSFFVVIMGVVITAVISGYLLKHLTIAHFILAVICIVVLIVFFKYAFAEKGLARKKMIVALVLMLEAIIFFTLYQQMPTSLNFFAIYNVKHTLFGISINPQSFQSLNPFWIVVLSPILAYFYTKWGSKGKDLSIASKFAVGMTLCGISFTTLYFSRFFADSNGMVSSWWLVQSYFFQSAGELMISALGVAMVAELVPQKIVGFIMGMWFLTSAIAGVTGGFIASLTAPPRGGIDATKTLLIYSDVFLKIGIVTLVIALVMWIVVPKINKYMTKIEE